MSKKTCRLTVDVSEFTETCDGCGAAIPKGVRHIGNIGSCRGQCYQRVCAQCTEAAYNLLNPAGNNGTPTLPEGEHKFDGSDIIPSRDNLALGHQYKRIFALMADRGWRTHEEIADALDYKANSVAAQLRNARKPQYGSWIVEKRLRGGAKRGLYEYRMLPREALKEEAN